MSKKLINTELERRGMTPLSHKFGYCFVGCVTLAIFAGIYMSDYLENTVSKFIGQDTRFLHEMVGMLQDRIQLPNDKELLVFTEPCQENDLSEKACTDSCDKPLSPEPKDRLKKLLFSPKLTLSAKQRKDILSMAQKIPENDVIILSAASSSHFNELGSMFHNLYTEVRPRLLNASVVVFDLGLTIIQRKVIESNCNCHIIPFPYTKFPRHVTDKLCFSWKPLIILATLERARKVVVYQDSSVVWLNDINVYVNRTEKYGVQLVRYNHSSHIPAHTFRKTFDYMDESPCAFLPFPELQTSIALYANNILIKKALLEPYARCALEASCMCPAEPRKVLPCIKSKVPQQCHRFDQSALSILSAILFNEDFYRFSSLEYSFYNPLYVVSRRDKKG